MVKRKSFPIKDIQFHERGLRNLNGEQDKESIALSAWHVLAIGFLQYGDHRDMDGPAAEQRFEDEDGRPNFRPRKIKPELFYSLDRFGEPSFRFEWEDE